jgi:hypothetical protein
MAFRSTGINVHPLQPGRVFTPALLCGLLLMAAGCSDGRPERVPASGTVTFQGESVAGAQVMFMPSGDRMAAGTTDADGRFELSTFEPGDGVVIGAHAVTVTKRLPDPNNDSPYPQFYDVLPPHYSNTAKSGLTAEVTAAGENVFVFELEDAAAP